MHLLTNNIKFLILTLFITTIGYSQNLVPGGIDAGADFTLDCTTGTCTTLSADFHQSHETNSRYTVNSVPFDPVVVTLPSSINADDDYTNAIDLGFTFCFFGDFYDQIVIGDNGLLSFNIGLYAGDLDAQWELNSPWNIPSASLPQDAVFGAFHDLYINEGGQITYGVTGTAPFRAFVINYKSVAQYNATNGCNEPTTQQIVLHETSNFIDVYLTEKPACTGWQGGTACVGIQKGAGEEGYFAPGRNTSDSPWTATNEAWRFAPEEAGGETFTFEWVNNSTGLVESTDPDYEVCPDITTTYTSNVTWIDCTNNTVSASDEVTITVDLPFTLAIDGGDQDFCVGDPAYNITTTIVTPSTTITGYNWYEASDVSTSLGSTDNLTVNTSGTYVIEVTDSGGCVLTEEVTINYNPAPNAGTDSAISFCSSDATLDLFTLLGGTPDATGSWSPALTSGTGVFDPAADTGGIYTYTVAGSGSCADATATITVTLDIAPEAGTDNTKAYCSLDAASDLFLELGGTPDLGGVWSPALTSGTGVFDPAVDAVGVYTYTVLGTGLCVDASATITVTVDIAPEAGSNGTINFCSSDVSVDLFTLLGGTPDTGGTWSPALTSGTGMFDPAVDTANIYTYIVIGGGCPDATSEVIVTIDTAPNAGTDGAVDLCTDNASIDLFDSLVGTPDVGGVWSPVLASGTGIFNPLVDVGGIYTYTVSPTGACSVDATATVTVTLNIAPVAGANGTMAYCSTDAATDLFLNLGGTPDIGGTWTPTLTSGTGVFDPLVDTAGNYTYTVVGLGICIDAISEVVVTIDTAPDAGTDGSIDLCTDNATVDLFDSLGGAPDPGGVWSPTLTSGTGDFDPAVDAAGIYTYTVSPVGAACFVDDTATVTVIVDTAPEAGIDGTMAYCSTDVTTDLFLNLNGTPDMGGTWSPALTSGTGMFDPAVDMAGIYTYTVAGVGVCADDSADIVVTVDIAPDAGIDDTVEFCSSDSTSDLINYLGGTPDATGTWNPALTSGTGIFDPAIDTAGSYTYTVSNGVCIDAVSTLDITVYSAPNSGIDDITMLCSDNPSIDLFTLLGGTPDTGGTWFPVLASGTGVFNPAVDMAGGYSYTVTGSGTCADATSMITVDVDVAPNAGIDNTIEFCSTDTALDLFTLLGGTPDTTGTWSPSMASGTGIFDPANDTGGIYTYTVSNGICDDDTSTVDVTLYEAPNAGTNGTADFCTNNNSADLIDYLGGTPDTSGTWTPTLTSGTGFFDPSVDLGGTYIYTVSGTGTCIDAITSVEVTVSSAPDAGSDADASFCMSESPVNLFSLLVGTPDSGGTWSPAMASGSGVFDPSVDAAGDYAYTVTGIGVCEDISAVISVSLSEAPRITNIDISDFSDNNIIVVDVEGAVSGTAFGIGDFEYSLDGVSFQSDNIFEGVPPGNYVLTVKDANGCLPPAFKNISIIGAGKFFTPNNDGHNDTWNIINLTEDILVNPGDGVSIFDRFGKLVANIKPSAIIGWDGYYNGNPLPSGDYWYSLLIKDSDGNPLSKKGHFSLVRR